ncbi:MAG: ABC transporter substrate-binding protein [Thermaerobacterales bacterium]
MVFRKVRPYILVLAVSLSALLIAACGGIGGTGGGGDLVDIVVAIDSDPPSLDGHENVLISGGVVVPHLYDKLVEFDMNSEIIPQLATEWSTSEDGLTWTFKLREGHNFHDGTPVNAEAVKANFDRLFDEDNPFTRRTLFSAITEVRAVDEYTVAFITEEPYAFVLNVLANPTASIVSPTAAAQVDLDTFGSNPVGSGPYIFKEWVRGTHILVEKNPDHWLADESNINSIEFRPIPEDSSRAIGLETGELDFVTSIAPQEAKRLQGEEGLTVYNLPRVRIQGLYLNVLHPPFDDVRVRQAIAHAIDKEAIVDTFLHGFAEVADSPLPKGVWPYKSQEQFEYNPDKARELLAEAGYPDGFKVPMWVPVGTYVSAQEISEAIAEMTRQVGIEFELEVMESAQWLQLLRSHGPEDNTMQATYYGWGTHTAEADYALRLVFHSGDNWAPACCNRNFYSNPEVDRLLQEGRVAISEDERRAAYERAQEIIWQDQSWVHIFAVNHSAVGKKELTGVEILPTEWIHFREARME